MDRDHRGEQVEGSWIETIVGNKPAYQESIRRRLRELRKELRGGEPSPLERLLVERILACWLALHYAEAMHAQLTRKGGLSWEAGTYYQERVDRGQKRYLAAIKALAQVRRLQVPVVQVNVAEKQVNVAASVAAG